MYGVLSVNFAGSSRGRIAVDPRRSRRGGSGCRAHEPPRAGGTCPRRWCAGTARGRRWSCRCGTLRRSDTMASWPGTMRSKSSASQMSPTELDAVGGKARDVLAVARVGELVEHGHVHLGMLAHHMVHEIAADEAAAAGNDDVLGLGLFHVIPHFIQHRIIYAIYFAVISSAISVSLFTKAIWSVFSIGRGRLTATSWACHDRIG